MSGDCFCPPPLACEKYSLDRNSASPGASRLIATPEMMWSTPKVTVATACSSPPTPATTPSTIQLARIRRPAPAGTTSEPTERPVLTTPPPQEPLSYQGH